MDRSVVISSDDGLVDRAAAGIGCLDPQVDCLTGCGARQRLIAVFR
jgi:hypothetical protein